MNNLTLYIKSHAPYHFTVTDRSGATVWMLVGKEHFKEIARLGYMKTWANLSGLKRYLKDMGFVPKQANITFITRGI